MGNSNSSQKKKEDVFSADDLFASLADDLKDVDKAPLEDEALVLSDSDEALSLEVLDLGDESSESTLMPGMANLNSESNNKTSFLISDGDSVEPPSQDSSLSLNSFEDLNQPLNFNIDIDASQDVNLLDNLGNQFNLNEMQANPVESLFNGEVPPSALDKPTEVASTLETVTVQNSSSENLFQDKTPQENEPMTTVAPPKFDPPAGEVERTVALYPSASEGEGERTVAVSGFSNQQGYIEVKPAVGQSRGSSGYGHFGGESNLVLAENLRIAQSKILDLEKDNDKLRYQNDELTAAAEIVKERADLLNKQLNELISGREDFEKQIEEEKLNLETLLKAKDYDVSKAKAKVAELENRLQNDLRRIRSRERELENRLELIRAEKNALTKAKDLQILDLKRQLDEANRETDKYRERVREQENTLEIHKKSFSNTQRALKLALQNLDSPSEKTPFKKAE